MAYSVGVDISIKTIGTNTVAGYPTEDNLQWNLPTSISTYGTNYTAQNGYTAFRYAISLAANGSATLDLTAVDTPLSAPFDCAQILGYALHNTGLYASPATAGNIVVSGTCGISDTVKPGCLSSKFFPLDSSYVAGGYSGTGTLILTNSSASLPATGFLILYGNPNS